MCFVVSLHLHPASRHRCNQVPISKDEFSRAVEWVDKDESGELDVEEFIGELAACMLAAPHRGLSSGDAWGAQRLLLSWSWSDRSAKGLQSGQLRLGSPSMD